MEFNRRNARAWSLLGPSGAFGTAALELVEARDDIIMLTADLCHFSGLDRLKDLFPDRLYNCGIAEQNMIGMAAGFAKEGFIPFTTTYASFASSRCADQVRVCMSYMGLPIKLIGFTAGCSAGVLGATHMSIEDIALMRALPNITVLSPADCTETVKAVLASAQTPEPTYIRLSGSTGSPVVYSENYEFVIGKAIRLRDGEDICIISTGSLVYPSIVASNTLLEHHISCAVLNMHTIKPLDEDALIAAASQYRLIVIAEEHNVYGGLYGAVVEFFGKCDLHPTVKSIGISDFFPTAGSYRYQMEQTGLTSDCIVNSIMAWYSCVFDIQ